MYQVSVFNNGMETIIHYPNSDKATPHINSLPLKEGLSMVDSLSFILYSNSPAYNNLYELTTKIKVIDVRDNSVRFSGRVLDVNESMDDTGLFFKEVLCESALAFLNDSKVRNAILAATPTGFLTELLSNHNSKVDATKQIQMGNVDVTGDLSVDGGFRTSLEVALEVKQKLGGDIRVRETNGVLYLDWLKSFSDSTINVELGANMKDMVKGKDVTSLGTRIIPLGANNLTIKAVNGGLDYIEDANARANYGIIEKTVEYKDITEAIELYNTCLADLSSYTQPLYLLESNAVDLSFKTGIKPEQFVLGVNLHLINHVMSVNDIYKIVQIEVDLIKAYDPKLVIANFPVKLSTSINDLRKASISNNGVYNGVQVGDAFGIRVASSDGRIVTTLNATEGISIENLIRNLKVFYVDTEGNIIHDGKHQTSFNGVVLIENWKNNNGGLTKIFDNSGNLNVKIGSESGTGGNIGGSLILFNDGEENPRAEMGISVTNDAGIINVRDSSGTVRASLYADSNLGPVLAILDETGTDTMSYIAQTEGVINNKKIATWPRMVGDFGSSGGKIYPTDSPNFYIEHASDGRCIIHWDSSSYCAIAPSVDYATENWGGQIVRWY